LPFAVNLAFVSTYITKSKVAEDNVGGWLQKWRSYYGMIILIGSIQASLLHIFHSRIFPNELFYMPVTHNHILALKRLQLANCIFEDIPSFVLNVYIINNFDDSLLTKTAIISLLFSSLHFLFIIALTLVYHTGDGTTSRDIWVRVKNPNKDLRWRRYEMKRKLRSAHSNCQFNVIVKQMQENHFEIEFICQVPSSLKMRELYTSIKHVLDKYKNDDTEITAFADPTFVYITNTVHQLWRMFHSTSGSIELSGDNEFQIKAADCSQKTTDALKESCGLHETGDKISMRRLRDKQKQYELDVGNIKKAPTTRSQLNKEEYERSMMRGFTTSYTDQSADFHDSSPDMNKMTSDSRVKLKKNIWESSTNLAKTPLSSNSFELDNGEDEYNNQINFSVGVEMTPAPTNATIIPLSKNSTADELQIPDLPSDSDNVEQSPEDL